MRIRIKLTVLFLFVALGASGWGNVMTSTFCAHVMAAAGDENGTNVHACCPAGHTNQETHCDTISEPTRTQAIPQPRPVDVAISRGSSFQVIPACDHCFGRSDPLQAYIALSETCQPRRVTDALVPYASQSNRAHQISFNLSVFSRQGAPPGAQTSRHVLFNVFLI